MFDLSIVYTSKKIMKNVGFTIVSGQSISKIN